jgi:citrate lyase subunit beta/citryl-CoA lyase
VTLFSPLVRRSILMVPILDREEVAASWRRNADAVALDLAGTVEKNDKVKARGLLADSIDFAGRGGAEVFVRINKDLAYADIKAAALPGLTGVILPGAETGADVEEAGAALAEMERREGIPAGSLEIFLLLNTSKGIWNVRKLLRSGPRVSAVAVDESGLCQTMGVVPSDDVDPLTFAKGRVIVETLAVLRLPIGMAHPLGARPRQLEDEALEQLATRARNTGFKGTICPYPSWVGPCNRAYTPTDEQVAYYREVRAAFAEGVARGTAAVPFRGRMLDVPVDERAKDMIALWERCRRRDEEKAAKLEAAGNRQ